MTGFPLRWVNHVRFSGRTIARSFLAATRVAVSVERGGGGITSFVPGPGLTVLTNNKCFGSEGGRPLRRGRLRRVAAATYTEATNDAFRVRAAGISRSFRRDPCPGQVGVWEGGEGCGNQDRVRPLREGTCGPSELERVLRSRECREERYDTFSLRFFLSRPGFSFSLLRSALVLSGVVGIAWGLSLPVLQHRYGLCERVLGVVAQTGTGRAQKCASCVRRQGL